MRTLSLILYVLALLPGLIYGAVYLVRRRFMPYHQAALGRTREELDLPTRTLLLGWMKIVGGGMLGCAIAGGFLLFVPFRAGEAWANWALLAIVLCGGLPAVYSTFLIHARTGAATPRAAALLVPSLGLAAFITGLLS